MRRTALAGAGLLGVLVASWAVAAWVTFRQANWEVEA